jgi:erythronate-4-phosphate dehydrogenase
MWALPNHARMDRLRDSDELNIIVDRNVRGAESTFGRHGRLTFLDGRSICPGHLEDAEALIIRTATRVDHKLLRGCPVGFVGTTSIGTDHLDIEFLNRQGISWANAPGCNADSAAQYTLAMIWLACRRLDRNLADLRVGIIGRGNVGSRLLQLLTALGVKCVANDPPLSEQGVTGLVSLDEALKQDIVSLHVPLDRTGPYPTYRFISSDEMIQMPDGALLVNAARGDVVDGDALEAELSSGRLHAALDVWPGEPNFNSSLLELSCVATPHVAGYSEDGKRNGTRQVYEAFCSWSGLSPAAPVPPDIPKPVLELPDAGHALSQALDSTCFVNQHDQEMRRLIPLDEAQRAVEFDRLRKDYPMRRDFQAWTIKCPDPALTPALRKIGFSVNPNE